MDTEKTVSSKLDISTLIFDQSEAGKCQDICHQYTFIRRVKGDGNCFYRALAFRHLELLLHNERAIQRFKDTIIQSGRELLAAGFEENSFKDLLNTFVSVLEQSGAEDKEEILVEFFNDPVTSDSIVQYLRLLTSAYLQNHAEFFQNFVEAPSLKAYCLQEVETMAMECDHVEILALTEALDLSLCIVSTEGDGHLTYHIIPEGSRPSLHLLYRTSHYDILYKGPDH
ncbi:ubiquitin thioesterase OTUB2 [Chanos chanos]|uniref:ubiquitinyl hydrolase 1 n=1 Tax=Chanos chanos TaxID=29144 RepID=A0A6J2VFY4_CHACN|nr:ubiquitin thioesterase OTUB2 [Chanos chanos]